MQKKDFYPYVSFKGGVLKTIAADGANIIDLSEYPEGALILVVSETITDGTFTFELKEGDAIGGGDLAAVADTDLVSGGPTAGDLEPVFAASADDVPKWFYYKGNKRYLRLDLKTVAGSPGTGGSFVGLIIPLGAFHKPVV